MNQIIRHEALSHARKFLNSNYRVFFIEARAGQGKTVLAKQMIEAVDTPSGWCTVQEGDNDPFLFFDKVINAFSENLSAADFSSAGNPSLIQVAPDELPGFAADKISAGLESCDDDFILFLDDAHHLTSAGSLMLLQALTRRLPEHIKFVILTRSPLRLDGADICRSEDCFEVDDEFLSFSAEETVLFFNSILKVPIDSKDVGRILESTGGWAMGLFFYGHGGMRAGRMPNSPNVKALDKYFDSLPIIQENITKELCLLSFPGDIPESFMEQRISHETNGRLRYLCSRNYFINTCTTAEGVTYNLHHLFRDYLRRRAEQEIPAEDRTLFFQETARWFFGEGKIEKGLEFLVFAEDWPGLNDAFRQQMVFLLARNRHYTMEHVLNAVPDTVVRSMGWLSLTRAVACFVNTQKTASPWLDAAIELFRNEEDPVGEMVALAFLIHYHMIIGGEFRRLDASILRCEELYHEHEDALSPDSKIQCLTSLTMGNSFTLHRVSEAYEFGTKAVSTAREHDLLKTYPSAKLCRLTAMGAMGDVHGIAEEFEELFNLTRDDHLSPMSKFSIDFIYLNYLEMRGRFFNYFQMRGEYVAEHAKILENSYLVPFLYVWDMDALVAQGKIKEALKLVETRLNSPGAAIGHICSQYLHYKVLILALLGREDEALDTARTSLRMRAEVGSRYFILLNHALIGAALSLTSYRKIGERMLDKVARAVEFSPEKHLKPIIHSYLAVLFLKTRRKAKARKAIEKALTALKHFNTYHFFGWNPDLMRIILGEAVRSGILPGFARALAERQMDADVLDNGEMIPLLRACTKVGPLTFRTGDGCISAADLNPLFRRFLTFLAEAPGMALTVEEIMEHLWPDASKTRARNSFDGTLKKIRKIFETHFGSKRGNQYIELASSIISLKHCRLDTEIILREAESGMKLAAASKPWQAHCAFARMQAEVENLPGYPACFARHSAHVSLETSYQDAILCWIQISTRKGDNLKALGIIDSALKISPLSDRLQGYRIALLNRLKRPGEAVEAMNKHRAYLVSLGKFGDGEIKEMMEAVTQHSWKLE